jgi:branched-chain amino acid transport system substrate-binding protein
MKPIPRTGDLTETSFAEVLDFLCRSGQTAAVAVTIPRSSGGEATGAFFIDAGTLVDARFDGREGDEAVRHALRLHRGRFQVEPGSRSPRKTVREPWKMPAESNLTPPLEKPSPPLLFPVDGAARAALAPIHPTRPTPASPLPAAPPPPPTPPSQSGAHRAPAAAAVGLHTTGENRTPGAPARGAPPPGVPSPNPATSAPRPLHASGPTTSPFSGPHTPPPRTASAPGTAPFSSVRRESRGHRFLPAVVLILLAVVVGGGLAAGVAHLLNKSASPAASGESTAAKPTVQVSATPSVLGVSETEITLGMAAPLTGVSKELGRQMKVGLDVAFAHANAEGGIHGRKLKLVALDDGYEPTRTKDVMRELVEQRGVFGFIGNVGTPTAAVAVPYALERKMLFFSPFTGASLLRKEPPDRYVFNYRASYAEETAAIVRYLVEVRRIKPEQIAVFAQDDSYGDAGFQGVAKVLRQLRRGSGSILKVTYKRNTSDVVEAVSRILDRRANVAAVVMVATYRPAARFIEKVREQRPGMIFSNVSFVGSQALAEELVQLGPQYPQGVIVTQVVPLPTGQSTVGLRYREALSTYAPGEKPDFISLEGYITGNLLVEALKRTGPNLNTESLVEALEGIHGLDLGLGVPLNFGLSEHQGSHKVWGTVLDATGGFQSLELE